MSAPAGVGHGTRRFRDNSVGEVVPLTAPAARKKGDPLLTQRWQTRCRAGLRDCDGRPPQQKFHVQI